MAFDRCLIKDYLLTYFCRPVRFRGRPQLLVGETSIRHKATL